MTPAKRTQRVTELVAATLNSTLNSASGDRWTAALDHVVGPGTLGVRIRDHEGTPPSHVDLGFVLNRTRDDAPVIWDCVSGAGNDLEQALAHAVEIWAVSTVPPIRELLEHKGEHAEHLEARDPRGLPGWHCIHGPIFGLGANGGGALMQEWVRENPLLPALATSLSNEFDRPMLNGVKFLFGGDIAEVRINGVESASASSRLRELPWPRLDPFAFARCFVLAVRPMS